MFRILAKGCRKKCKNINLTGSELKARYGEAEDMLYNLSKAQERRTSTDSMFDTLSATCYGAEYTVSGKKLLEITRADRKRRGAKVSIAYRVNDNVSDSEKQKLIDQYRVEIEYGQDVAAAAAAYKTLTTSDE